MKAEKSKSTNQTERLLRNHFDTNEQWNDRIVDDYDDYFYSATNPSYSAFINPLSARSLPLRINSSDSNQDYARSYDDLQPSRFVTKKSRSTNETKQSRSKKSIDDLKAIIEQGNLTELEDLVLRGYGEKLLKFLPTINELSRSVLVIEFFENLPNYLVRRFFFSFVRFL